MRQAKYLPYVAVCSSVIGAVLPVVYPASLSSSVTFKVAQTISFTLLVAGAAAGCITLVLLHRASTAVSGRRAAILAVVVSVCVGLPLLAAYTVVEPGKQMRREHDLAMSSMDSLVRIREALLDYASKHGGTLPSAKDWQDRLLEAGEGVSKSDFCRATVPGGTSDYALNEHLGGLTVSEIPGDVVLVFEATGPWNLSGGGDLLQHSGRKWKVGVMFMDGQFGEYCFVRKAVMGRYNASFVRALRWQ